MSRNVSAILAAGLWINASEFLRNEVILKGFWVAHYKTLGLTFPDSAVNGMLWIVWGFVCAITIFAISRRFALAGATALAWTIAFVMMWIVTFNLDVLPPALLAFAVPLSILEIFVATLICRKLAPPEEAGANQAVVRLGMPTGSTANQTHSIVVS